MRSSKDKHRALSAREKLLEREDLPPITDGGLREDLQFRYGIEGDAGGVDPLHFGAYPLNRFAQLNIRGVEDSIIRFLRQPLGDAIKFQQIQSIQVPAMGSGDIMQFFKRFRKRYIQTFLAAPGALEQKLKRQCRLPAPGIALDDVEAVGGQTAAQDLIQSCNTRFLPG